MVDAQSAGCVKGCGTSSVVVTASAAQARGRNGKTVITDYRYYRAFFPLPLPFGHYRGNGNKR